MWTDFRLALRTLRKSPAFTLAAVCSLALGIAACTTLFSAADALILRAVSFAGADRLIGILETTPSCENCSTAAGDFAMLHDPGSAEGGAVFSGVAASRPWTGSFTRREGAERVTGELVTPGYFSLLGAHPLIGRTFDVDSTSTAPVHQVVLGERFWRSHFAADPHIAGSTITLDGTPYVVKGVVADEYALGAPVDLWRPLIVTPAMARDHLSHGYALYARLAPGVTLAESQRRLDAVSARIAADFPEQDLGVKLRALTLSDELVGGLKTFFLPLLAAVGLVLLIVCANVAGLTLARASGRAREIAVRAALGAGRWRIARQLLAESLLVGVLGAIAGIALAWGAIPLLRGSIPASFQVNLPGWSTLSLNGRAMAFTVALGVMSALLFGVVPALRASRADLGIALKDGMRGTSGAQGGRLRQSLVVVEVALALVLLAGAGVVLRSLGKLLNSDAGFHAERTLTMALQVPRGRYAGADRAVSFDERLRTELGALPSVRAVGGSWNLPLSGTGNFTQYDLPNRPPTPLAQQPSATDAWVTPGYFAALGIPLLRGRDFTARDDSAAPNVVIVSQAFAKKAFPGEDPIGRGVLVNQRSYEVIGVAADVRNDGLELDPAPALYRSIEQVSGIPTSLVIRTEGDPAALTASVRQALGGLDADIAIADVATMPAVMSNYLTPWRILSLLLGSFSVLALMVAAVGIYGVMMYAVAQRTHEIGIRMALGAGRGQVLRLVLGQAMALAMAGIILGTLGALAATRVLSFLLFQVSPEDPLVLSSVALILGLVALVACCIPALKATRVDPLRALRAD